MVGKSRRRVFGRPPSCAPRIRSPISLPFQPPLPSPDLWDNKDLAAHPQSSIGVGTNTAAWKITTNVALSWYFSLMHNRFFHLSSSQPPPRPFHTSRANISPHSLLHGNRKVMPCMYPCTKNQRHNYSMQLGFEVAQLCGTSRSQRGASLRRGWP